MPGDGGQPDEPRIRSVPDDLPRDGLFAPPLVSDDIRVLEPDTLADGQVRAAFRVTVRDAEGKRCPDLAVHARIDGPQRSASGMGHTDLMGRVTFRMTGPHGTYRFEVTDIAAGALDWDRDASVVTASTEV